MTGAARAGLLQQRAAVRLPVIPRGQILMPLIYRRAGGLIRA